MNSPTILPRLTSRPTLQRLRASSLLPLALLLTLMAGACATDDADDAAEAPDSEAQSNVGATELQEGYSLLFANLSGLQHVDKAFLIKFETDRVQEIVTAVSDYAATLRDELQGWADNNEAVRVDLEPLPEIEKRKLAAVQKDRLLSFAPVVGRTGANFQRTLLLSQSGALNQLRHLTEVLAEADTDSNRSQRMLEASERFDQLYGNVVVALNDLYFCHDDPQPSLDEGD